MWLSRCRPDISITCRRVVHTTCLNRVLVFLRRLFLKFTANVQFVYWENLFKSFCAHDLWYFSLCSSPNTDKYAVKQHVFRTDNTRHRVRRFINKKKKAVRSTLPNDTATDAWRSDRFLIRLDAVGSRAIALSARVIGPEAKCNTRYYTSIRPY